MENKKLLIGAGVVIVGYLLWKKSQSKVNQTQYSKECYDSLQSRLMQEDVKPANFSRDFLENCKKSENEKKSPSNKGGLAMPIIELDWSILSKIPNEFTVKSNGFNTRYYKNIDKNLTGFSSQFSVPELYSQSFRTDGSIGSSPPLKISTREFSDAYSVFLKQPK